MTRLTLLALAGALLVAAPADAQDFPSRTVRIVVPFTAGGANDGVARAMADRLAKKWGQSVVVENRPGGATTIGTRAVIDAAPDGHTLLFTTSAIAINRSLFKNLPFDALRDFAPISVFAESPNLLVAHQSAGANLAELIAKARAKPGSLNYSSAGSGTTQHMAGELLKARTSTFIVHIPYKGTAPSLTAVIAGEVNFSFANVPAILGHVKSGRLRALAVAAPKRSTLMPDVPTMKEAGVDGVEVPVWYALLAPAATPREMIATLGKATERAAQSPDTRQRLIEQGAEPVANSPEEFSRLLREEVGKWAEVVKISGAKSE